MYYSITNRTDKEVGNVFPQVDCLNQYLAHSIQFEKPIDLKDDLAYSLKNKAKLTDALSQAEISALGILLNERFKNLLSNFKLLGHHYNQSWVKMDNGKIYDYFWLHLFDNLENLEWLDYAKSTFIVKEYGFKKDDISLTSYQDYKVQSQKVGDMSVIIIKDIKIKENAAINADMFVLPYLSRKIFISEKLKYTLQEKKITGLLIEEAF
ncbi:MAG: hypothetical protein REI78_00370 [Pedobacter sp.]|nr:hypothetical protein [Pedobacter sp.]